MSDHQFSKALIWRFHEALDHAVPEAVADLLHDYTTPDFHLYAVHPFGKLEGAAAAAAVYAPLKQSFTSLQRRPFVFMAGTSEIDNTEWVISTGHFMGLFDEPWLGIPATGKIASLRYADFHCIEDGKITRAAFFCDMIDLMEQAGVNPLPTSTGAAGIFPSPRTQDGLLHSACDPEEGVETLALIDRMVHDLNTLNQTGEDHCPPEYLARTWHNDMGWYGPAGIGATMTIRRYQHQHQYPYREGVQNKIFNGHLCRLAEGMYGGFFGWPNLTHTPVGGLMGLPGSDKPVDMRVVDIYRREGDKLAENWIIIDLPWWLKQQGLDVFARLESLRSGHRN